MTSIAVSLEQHFVEYRGGIYTDIAFAYPYWREYLEIFEEVYPIARVRSVDILPEGWQRADGEKVHFIRITDYRGFWDFLRKMSKVVLDCRRATRYDTCYLFRGGTTGTICSFFLRVAHRPYAVEIVGHASESVVMLKNLQFFGLARIIGYICQKIAIYRVRKAVCASYTSCYLKRLYPTKTSTNEWVFSSVRLDKSVILGPKHTEQFNAKPFTIVSVGRVEPEKGHIVLIHAVEQLVHSGYNISLTIIGPGSEIDNLRKYVSEHGLSQQVTIYGPVPWGPDLFAEIDKACIFVLPSFTEGMPRALIEAMARGLPAIGSDVGGIKELLSEKYLVPPKDSKAIAAKIAEMIDDIPRLTMASNENFQKALEYRPEIMNQRKLAFWKCIKDTCRSK